MLQITALARRPDASRPELPGVENEVRGSGFVVAVDPEAGEILVLTNAHVVHGVASATGRCEGLGSRRQLLLEPVATCPERDLSLLRCHDGAAAAELEAVCWGDSVALQRGDAVAAVGHPLGCEHQKLTTGVFCGVEAAPVGGMDMVALLQTDAALNPGSSGGPLCAPDGSVVGVACSGVPSSSGTGFAIPSRTVAAVMDAMMVAARWDDRGSAGQAAPPAAAVVRVPSIEAALQRTTQELLDWCGAPDDAAVAGLYVAHAYPGARRRGLRRGDVLVAATAHLASPGGSPRFNWLMGDRPGSRVDMVVLDCYGDVAPRSGRGPTCLAEWLQGLPVAAPGVGGCDLELRVLRGGASASTRAPWRAKPDEGELRPRWHPHLPEPAVEVGGMQLTQLRLEHAGRYAVAAPWLQRFVEMPERLQPKLLVCRVDPHGPAGRAGALHAGAILERVAGAEVHTVPELESALARADAAGEPFAMEFIPPFVWIRQPPLTND